jgi:hypothetical protein
LFTIAAALIADFADLLGDAPDTLITAEAMHDIATAQTIADSASMSMSMRPAARRRRRDGAGWHVHHQRPDPRLERLVLFQTDGSARTVQFQTSAVNMGEA